MAHTNDDDAGDTAGESAGTSQDPIALALKAAREEAGMTVKQLHEQTGISRAVLFGYEAGRTRPGARELRLLCEALRVTPNRLLFGSEEPFAAPRKEPAARLAEIVNSSQALSLVFWMMAGPAMSFALSDSQKRSLFEVALSMLESSKPGTTASLVGYLDAFDREMHERGLTFESLAKLSEVERMAFVTEVTEKMAGDLSKNPRS